MLIAISMSIIAVLVLIDQALKYIINATIPVNGTVPIINGVIHISNVKNTGAAFSLFGNQTWLLVYLTAAIIIVMLGAIVLKKFTDKKLVIPLSVVIAGGIGNLIDRIFYKAVTDFIDFRIINFAVFNFADCCVVIGCVLVVIYIIFSDKLKSGENDATNS